MRYQENSLAGRPRSSNEMRAFFRYRDQTEHSATAYACKSFGLIYKITDTVERRDFVEFI